MERGYPAGLLRMGLVSLAAWLAVCSAGRAATGSQELSGEQVYQKRCAACHGPRGEGNPDHYPEALVGERTVAQLTRYISKRMPEDAPGTCVGVEAQRVAAYLHDAFYSPAAQARNRPPRLELARLTVRQYRQALADLVETFRWAGKWGDERGLHAEYINSRNVWERKVLERRDPTVHFDFGTSSPDPKIDPHTFSIRWNGSILAPVTGEYEFTVRTEHAARLWINDNKHPLVDAWVRSGTDTEHRATLYLLGGRAYPLRLEFSKAQQGVDDKKKNKKLPVEKASIALEWKLPHRPAEVVPARSLSPASFPEQLVVTTPFPPDDRSMGYERGTTISKAWDQAATDAAIEAANYVVAHLHELTHSPDNAPVPPPAARDFCRRFAERALRRPLTPEQQRFFVDRHLEKGGDLDLAVKRALLLVLKSPRFLYREAGSRPDGYTVASRLSFALGDSLPDAQLLEAARGGQLAGRDQVVRQAERLLGDLRARAKLHDFFLQWLKVEQVPDLAKDGSQYPGFDAAVASDLRTSLELFLEDVVWSEASDFRQLLLSDTLYLNGRLARLYGAPLPADAPFQKVTLEPGKRVGLLSHPYLMAVFAYTASSSPIHRGVFLARNVLGQTLRPPPEAFTPLPADLHPSLTTRERVTLQTRPQMCQSCHGTINPLGFTLESFDAIGRFREQERGRPIDTTGSYLTRSGERVTFSGPRDLAQFLAGSTESQDAFVASLFHNLVKQPIRAHGPQVQAQLRQSFVAKSHSIRKLVVEIAATAALPPPSPAPAARPHRPGQRVSSAPKPDAPGRNNMVLQRTRREFIRDLGIGSASLPFLLNLPSLGFANQQARKQRLVVMFSPNGVVPSAFWPDEEGSRFTLKESLKPLAPLQSRTLILKGVCDKVRGDGDNHMRGIGCLLTGCELFPGNIQGGSDTPAGWAKGRSIDQEIRGHLQSRPATRTRFGSLELGVLVPDRADTWTRMVYAGPNRPLAPIDDPYQVFAKLYGRLKDQESLRSILDDLQDDLRKVEAQVSAEDRRLLEEHATFVREMEQELRQTRTDVGHAVPPLEPNVKKENDNIPRISKMQIDLLVNSFASDFTRVATLQYTNSVGQARMRWIGVKESHHELSHRPDNDKTAQDELTRINRWFCEQLAYLAKRLAETPEPGGPGSLLDNTLLIWTNELGKGNSHTLDDIPFVLVGNGLDFRMGRSLHYKNLPHNRLLLSLAHGFGHRIPRFGNPDYCGAGPLPDLT